MRLSSSLRLAAVSAAALAAAPVFAQDAAVEPFSGLYVAGTFGKVVQANDGAGAFAFDRNLDGTFGDPIRNGAGADAFGPYNGSTLGFCGGAALGASFAAGCGKDRDGYDYSGRVGFDKQFGPFVVGAIGEFGDSTTVDRQTAYSITPASYTLSRRIDWEASARLRAGYAPATTLFYAHGGAGYANIKRGFSTSNTTNTFTLLDPSEKQFGFIVGGGIEQKITQNISLGIEYGYHDYKDKNSVVRVTGGASGNPFILAPNTTGTDLARTDENFRWHSVKAVAAFRF